MTDPRAVCHGVAAGVRVLAVVWLAASCVYDGDNRCSPNQQLDARGVCVCLPGHAFEATTASCVACGMNEEVRAGGCACIPGHSREAAGKPCAAAPTGLGASCSAANVCRMPPFGHCQASRAGDSYCTTAGCSASVDCAGGYTCDRSGATPFCRRPPTGEGKSCSAPDDCKGLEASHCESFFVHTCLVEGCNVQDPATCSDGWKCCDVTPLGLPKTLCLKMDKCP